MANISFLILAAGKGTRMKSKLPKVLHHVGGIPMIERVVRTAASCGAANVCVVVGHGAGDVINHVKGKYPKTQFAVQKSLNGSGGAVRAASAWLKKQRGTVVVACGDAPLITKETFLGLVKLHGKEKNVATVLTTKLTDPAAYGRIVRGLGGDVEKIVEFLDADADERSINEINSGTYAFDARSLSKVLPKLSNKNAKREFYLTDTLELLRSAGGRIGGQICPDSDEVQGINSRLDLSKAERTVGRRKVEELMAAGVTVIDPEDTYVADTVKVGPDTVLWPQTFLLGSTVIGSGCQIGPWARVNNTVIENDVIFQASFSDDAIIRNGAKVGPYSRVRPKSDIGPDVHLGNFSEVKNAQLGRGAKVNHLSYLGDAKIGKFVNIGAGTITCNYDGIRKSPTLIQDNAFIGSNTNLIAPVRVGAHAVIGAGSSISQDVPAWSLAVERASRVTKDGWAKKHFSKGKKKK